MYVDDNLENFIPSRRKKERKRQRKRNRNTYLSAGTRERSGGRFVVFYSLLETRDNIRENAFQRGVPLLLFFTVASTKIRLVRWHRENTNYNFPSFSTRRRFNEDTTSRKQRFAPRTKRTFQLTAGKITFSHQKKKKKEEKRKHRSNSRFSTCTK